MNVLSIKVFFKLRIMILLLLFCSNETKAQDELWTIVGVKKTSKKVDWLLLNMNFFHPDGSWFQNNTRFVLDFKSNTNIKWGLGYQQEYVKFPERTRVEYRPMLFLYYKKQFGFFDLQDMSTMEFRLIDSNLMNRYRNEMALHYTKFTGFSPFVSTEFFVNLDQLNYAGQRTVLGIDFPIQNWKLNVFSFYETNKDNQGLYSDKLVVGSALVYQFK